jgi:hypothetical protein
MPEPIPYRTLLELGVIQDEIDDTWNRLSDLDNRLGTIVEKLAGPMSDEAALEFWTRFSNDIDDARGQARIA